MDNNDDFNIQYCDSFSQEECYLQMNQNISILFENEDDILDKGVCETTCCNIIGFGQPDVILNTSPFTSPRVIDDLDELNIQLGIKNGEEYNQTDEINLPSPLTYNTKSFYQDEKGSLIISEPPPKRRMINYDNADSYSEIALSYNAPSYNAPIDNAPRNNAVDLHIYAEDSLSGEEDESNYVYYEISEPPPLPPQELQQDKSHKRSNKSKKQIKNKTTKTPIKRTKTCKSINSKYPIGKEIVTNMIVDWNMLQKYEKYVREHTLKCSSCEKFLCIWYMFRIDGELICQYCVKEKNIDKAKLTDNDIAEEENFDGMELFKCNRLDHARPIYYFMKYSNKTNEWRIEKSCRYCLIYKSFEYIEKKKRENAKN